MDVEQLQRENEALNEQVKLLVRTERRLYAAQHVIEQQLRRLEALTTLAAQSGRAGDPDRIFELALDVLVRVLDVDQAVALVPTRPGVRVAATTAQPGREPGHRHWRANHLEVPCVDRPTLLMPRPPSTDYRLVHVLDAVDDYFADDSQTQRPRQLPAVELVVPLKRKSGRLLALLVLRRIDLTRSLHQGLISEEDLPFVELVATRVEADVDNVLLYRDLERFAAGLEQKVAQRTVDLAKINDELSVSLRRVRDTQARLVEASKRATMLTLVAGLSHELNNPIAVILGYTQALLAGESCPSTKHQLGAIERQARRCGQLVKALLQFAEDRPFVLDSVPPAILLQRVIADAERDAAERDVRLSLGATAANLQSLVISEVNIREALGHIVKNAVDASVTGGRVRLQARRRWRNGVLGVELSVRDCGAGIPRAFLSRIFDPFFTTKPPGKAVGLGLSVARRCIESHGGRIDVRSKLGHGTLVLVWLPVDSGDDRTLRDAEILQ